MKNLFFLLIVLFLFTTHIMAQGFDAQSEGGNATDPSLYLDNDLDRAFSQEKKIEKFQTYFIQEVFTRPMFEAQHAFSGDDDEENEDDLFSNSKQDKEMMDSMLSHVLARDLAKKDVFRLKKILLQRADQF